MVDDRTPDDVTREMAGRDLGEPILAGEGVSHLHGPGWPTGRTVELDEREVAQLDDAPFEPGIRVTLLKAGELVYRLEGATFCDGPLAANKTPLTSGGSAVPVISRRSVPSPCRASFGSAKRPGDRAGRATMSNLTNRPAAPENLDRRGGQVTNP